ncbi:hypothetical protein T35B1_18538 [Salinisphaera shabanensis T35B1]
MMGDHPRLGYQSDRQSKPQRQPPWGQTHTFRCVASAGIQTINLDTAMTEQTTPNISIRTDGKNIVIA